MSNYTLEIELLSDTAFGVGSGVSTLVNSDIQHDHKGLPTISGRAIKGLLVNECSEILFALPDDKKAQWEEAALKLFGQRGEMLEDTAGVFIANASMPPDLVAAIHSDQKLTRQEVLDSLTSIRTQTAMNEMGAPQDDTLRSVRVLISGITLYAPLSFMHEADEHEKALLAACIMSLRRAGLHRNRGKGRLKVRVTARPLTALEFSSSEGQFQDQAPEWFSKFAQEVKK